MLSVGVFFIFLNFDFLDRWVAGGRTKNNPKWKIKITSVTHRILKKSSIWSWFLVHLCNMISPGVFSFFKILIFQVVNGGGGEGGKREKNGPKWNSPKCPSRSISQEPYTIWLSFMVFMVIAAGVFFHCFKILIFWVYRGTEGQKKKKRGNRAKNDPKWQKNSVCLKPHLRNRPSYGTRAKSWCL